jgi:hypothetical protein
MTPDVNLTLINDNYVPEVMLLSSVSVVCKLNMIPEKRLLCIYVCMHVIPGQTDRHPE